MTTLDERYKHYLYDLGFLCKEHAVAAKVERDRSHGTADEAYYQGQLMAFHRIISLMQQQAVAFDIVLADLRLEDINADQDLL